METRVGLFRASDLFAAESGLYVNRAEETFQLEFHAHDFLEIAYISEGRGYHHWGGRVVPVSKGDVFLLPIGTPHVFRPASADEREKLVVYNCAFTESMLKEASKHVEDAELFRLFEREGCQTRDARFTIEPVFHRMADEFHGKPVGSKGMLFALFLQLLIQLSRLLRQSDAAAPPPDAADRIGEAIDYIGRHASDNLSIRFFADRCGMSERHFFRLFKARTGLPFLEYVQRVRIRTSCELLLGTRHKIGVIAEMAGYRDAQTFYQTFRKIVGMTPGEYRKSEGSACIKS